MNNIYLKKIWVFYLEKYEERPLLTMLFSGFVFLWIMFILACLLTGGDAFFAAFFRDSNDVFMDYFHSIMYSIDDPYTKWNVIYPPLITSFYAFIGSLTVPFVDVSEGEVLSFVLRDSQMGLLSYFILVFVALYIIHLIVSKITEDTSLACRSEIVFMMLMFSFPMLFVICRGNCMIYALVFSVLFLMGYQSENKWVRVLSYLCLGIAAGIKVYPAFLGLLLIRERNWKGAVCCAVIGVVTFIAPFALTDGSMLSYLERMSDLGVLSDAGGVLMNVSAVVEFLFPFLSADASHTLTSILNGVLVLFTVIVVIFGRNIEKWELLFMIMFTIIMINGVPTMYLFAYLLIPFFMFLRDVEQPTRKNVLLVLCMIAIMSMIPAVPDCRQIVMNIRAVSMLIIAVPVICDCFQSLELRDRLNAIRN